MSVMLLVAMSFATNSVMTHSYVRHDLSTCAIRHIDITGWWSPIGCLKLQIIFRKRATHRRALLRRITYIDKASYGSSPPCTSVMHLVAMSFDTLSIMTRSFVRLWLNHITHSHSRHDSCIWATWLIHVCDKTHWYYAWDAPGSDVLCHALRHDSFICAMWLIHIIHSYGRYGASVSATWLMDIMSVMHLVAMSFAMLSVMTHSHMRHDSFIRLIHVSGMKHLYVR